ncbi:hypothetical protein OG563_28605 [Nocardia vinacea]|uniref:Uncharacterized protein n=1 Tax=Nocardia vinacea TaxID=96468 RepID=A0ABZ1YJF2_9NOCA|nr:hypothetical protein [Nocardia vinacea]
MSLPSGAGPASRARTSGTQIEISFADAPAELLPLALLEEIALNPGLDVS